MLDMSGSMQPIDGATIEGVDQYVRDLAETPGKTLVSLTAFNTVFDAWHVAVPAAEVPSISGRYTPGGMTALYDAIANTIIETEARLRKLGLADDKVLVVVVTDGAENSSREYAIRNDGRARLFELIRSYEEKGNWTFSYIGADVDAYADAEEIGIRRGNVMAASRSSKSTTDAYAGLSTATAVLASAGGPATASLYADAGVSADVRDEPADS